MDDLIFFSLIDLFSLFFLYNLEEKLFKMLLTWWFFLSAFCSSSIKWIGFICLSNFFVISLFLMLSLKKDVVVGLSFFWHPKLLTFPVNKRRTSNRIHFFKWFKSVFHACPLLSAHGCRYINLFYIKLTNICIFNV